MNNSLAGTYCNCRSEVKRRLAVVNIFTTRNLSTGSEIFDYEFVSIQLRKSLELVAFASMTANKELYEEAHANFANHWNAKRMLCELKRLHPDFYPKPIFLDRVKESGVRHFEYVQDGYLTQEDFITLYDLCSEVLHTWNPFTNKERYIDFKHSVAKWVQKINCLLRLHLMQFVDREEIWIVNMENPPEGKVYAFTGTPSS